MKIWEPEHLRRLGTGFAGIIVVGFSYVWFGHQSVQAAAAFIGLAAYYEYLRILISPENSPRFRATKISISLIAAVIFLLPFDRSHIWAFGLLIFFTLGIYRIRETDPTLFREHRYHLDDLFLSGFGLLYIVGFLSFLPEIHSFPDGHVLLAGLVVMIWASDIAAYYGGHTLGRHKLASVISPGKTLEGSICGVLGSIAVASVIHAKWLPWIDLPKLIALGFLTSVISQLGDLFESLLKRVVGVKDSGFLLPGHGGFLDRFDSLILAAPFYYLMLKLWIIH
jgi:phosphatidate cytidylyltransferase